MSYYDARDFQIHRSDAQLGPSESLKLDCGIFIEVEDRAQREIIQERMEAGISLDLLSGGFGSVDAGRLFNPTHELLVFGKWAAAFTITPGVAVTNDHNLTLLSGDKVLARSRDYDLLFFRTDSKLPAELAKPAIGETVVAYGQGGSNELREARGKVAGLDESSPAERVGGVGCGGNAEGS